MALQNILKSEYAKWSLYWNML